MSIRSPISKAIGLGTGGNGFHHWWVHLLSMIGYVLLSVYAVYAVIAVAGEDYNQICEWVKHPVNTVFLILLVSVSFYHFALTARVCIEDYIQPEWLKLTSIVAVNFLAIIFGMIGCIAILRVSLGG